jgi:hypothetical protein
MPGLRKTWDRGVGVSLWLKQAVMIASVNLAGVIEAE